jgi:uncharacterized protein (TIRG00374 family)
MTHEGASSRGRIIKSMLGWSVGIACLAWVLHDIHIERLLQDVGRIQWTWIVAAVVLDIVSYFAQGIRWRLLLAPLGRITSLQTTQAIYVGLFTNEILPLRIGEVVRTYLVSRRLSTGFMTVVPSLLVERFFDGVWLAAGIAATALLVELPPSLTDAADILGIAVLIAAAVLAIVVFRRGASRPMSNQSNTSKRGIGAKILAFFDKIGVGIRQIGFSRFFWGSFAVSSLIVVSQILSFWFVMIAYGIKISLWAGAAVLLIEHLGTTIPNAPSNLGTYQFFTVLGLSLFGIDKTTASGFSMVVFIVLTLPLWLFGFFALLKSGMTLKQIRSEIGRLRNGERTPKGNEGASSLKDVSP